MPRATNNLTTLPSVLDAVRRIQLCHAACSRLLDQLLAEADLPASGLRPQDLLLLNYCHEFQDVGASQRELAAAIGFSPTRVSVRLEHLRKQSLVVARRTSADRRRQTWRLTPAGVQVLNKLRQIPLPDRTLALLRTTILLTDSTSRTGQPRGDAA